MRRRGRVNREWFVPSFNFDQRRRSSLYTYLHVGYRRKSVSETSTQGRQSSFSRSEIHPIVSHVECRMQARKSWSLVLELFRRDLGSSAPLDPDCGVGRTVLRTYGVHVAVCRHRGLLVSTISRHRSSSVPAVASSSNFLLPHNLKCLVTRISLSHW